MDKKRLQQIFESEFNWDNWREVMDFVFPEFQYAKSQEEIPLDNALRQKYAQYIKQHGKSELADGESLVLYEIALNEKVRLDRNVKSVRKLIAGEVFAGYQIGLGVFHNKDKSKWRFTLVIREFTKAFKISDKKPESFTYVFGKGEKGRTAAERFLKLAENKSKKLKDLEEAFSVEALSKKFFTQYKEVYLQFVDDIVSNPSRLALFQGSDREKSARDFVKKMMGRIVFLYFLQKKGWMGCKYKWEQGDEHFMQTLFKAAGQNNDLFYRYYLEPLFFDTLNKKRLETEEDCIIEGQSFGKVPFLNGGLFEKEEGHPVDLTLSWAIFNKFFEILDAYNFTIIEDDPDFKEVAVDPEMLGHIFENLLEDNKDKGAFYTPKAIVQYMCQESLIEYLHTQLSKKIANEGLKEAIRDFVTKQHFVGLNNISQQADKHVLQALRDIKVCDPAIGSGAFPMGILHEIFRMVEALEDRDIFQSIWKMNSWDAARVKEDIIQNSIYGVDIEKGAVDIARLRFWLSIIIDEDSPKPLPNLDYKIMQGNSLLERFGSIDLKFDRAKYYKPIPKQENLFGEIENPQISIAEAMASQGFNLTEIERDYFHTEDIEVKETIRKEITAFEKTFISRQIMAKKDSVLKSITTLSKKLNDSNYSKLGEKKKDEKLVQKLAQELLEIDRAEVESKVIKEGRKPYFLWNLYFMEIFNEGGFDLVIGNPPYHGEKFMKEQLSLIKNSSQWEHHYRRRSNIYYFFIFLFETLGKQDATLNYIVPREFQTAEWANILRSFILDLSEELTLLDFEKSKVFQELGTSSLIIEINRATRAENSKIKVLGIDGEYNSNSSLTDQLVEIVRIDRKEEVDFYRNNYWSFRVSTAYKEGEIPLRPISDLYDVSQGIVTGADRVSNLHISKRLIHEDFKGTGIFILTKGKEVDEECSEIFLTDEKKWVKLGFQDRQCLKKYISSEHLKNFKIDESDEMILIFTEEIIPPIIEQYLRPFKKILINRSKLSENDEPVDFEQFLKLSSQSVKSLYSSAGAVQKIMQSKKWFLPLYQRKGIPFDGAKIIANTKSLGTFTYTDEEVYSSGGGLGGQNYIYPNANFRVKYDDKTIRLITKAINLFLNTKKLSESLVAKGYNQLSTSKISQIEVPDFLAIKDAEKLLPFLEQLHDGIPHGNFTTTDVDNFFDLLFKGKNLDVITREMKIEIR